MSETKSCSHTDQIKMFAGPEGAEGCEDCLKIGGTWVNLRMCLTCGHVGCCDNSPNRHARVHWETIGHPIIQSAEPGEDWIWCFADEVPVEALPPIASA
jgi:uncharacterized UBP type Zn finger protein